MRCSLLTLSSHLDGELDTTRRAETEAHLVGCDRCRNALEYLREEVSRISDLARVHVPDAGARAFLEQLGLIGPDDDLPPRPPRPRPPSGDPPPWLAGRPPGSALPWSPRIEPDPDADQPVLPFPDEVLLDEMAMEPPSPPVDSLHLDTELHLRGRSQPPSDGSLSVPAAPVENAPDASADVTAPGAADASEADPEVHVAGQAFPGLPISAPAGPPPSLISAAERPVWAPPMAGGHGSPALEPPERSPIEAPRAPARFPPGPEPRASTGLELEGRAGLGPDARVGAGPPGSGDQQPSSGRGVLPEPAIGRAADDPWSWAPRDPIPGDEPPGPPPIRSALSGGTGILGPQGREQPEGPLVSEDGAGEPAPPDRDDAPDPLIDPLIARVVRPPRRVRAGLLARVRDQLGVRFALMRGAGAAELAADRSTGTSPPPRGRRRDPTLTADRQPEPGPPQLRSAAQPAQSESGPDEPPVVPGPPVYPPWFGGGAGGPAAALGPPASAAGRPGSTRPPTIAEELPAPLRPSYRDDRRTAADLGDSPVPGRHARALAAGGRPWPRSWHGLGRSLAGVPRRWTAVAALAVLLLVIVLLIAHAAGGPSPVASPGSATHPSGAPASSAPSPARPSLTPASSPPAASSPAVSATSAPTASPTSTGPAAQTYGGGGSGWTIQSVRCCYAQAGTGYTRVVFELTGSSGSSPAASISFPNPTTMLISFTGASPGAPLATESGGVIAEMVPPTGSAAVFRFTLVKAGATVKDWDYLARGDASTPSPLMYFDIG